MSPKDPSHLRSLPEALPNAPFRSSAETPAGPSSGKCHLSRKPARRSSPRKPLSTRLQNRPFGLSFGTCHVSRRASRKLPRKPFEATPRDLPDLPSEHATCFRVPSENPSSGSRPNLPSVPESLNSKLPPGALRAATCPETHPGRIPNTSRKPRMRCVPECRVRFPRMPPVAPRVPSEPEPQTSRMPPGSPRITPGRPSRALGECAACRSSRERTFCLL